MFRRTGGSGDRLDDWLEEHYEGVYRTAHLILLDADRAEAAAREAFLRAWRFRAAAPAGPGPGVRLWLLRAVVHSSQRELRAVAVGDPVSTGDPVLRALAALPSDERIAVVLRFWAGLDPPEAADVLDERLERVMARLEAAMAHLAGGPLAVATGFGMGEGQR